MIGAIIGDTIGSIYEFRNNRSEDFDLFDSRSNPTDDSILTIAIYDIIKSGIYNNKEKMVERLKHWAKTYDTGDYGGRFRTWLYSDNTESYESYGNGSAMRISSVGWLARSEEEVIELSNKVTAITHSHPYGMKGALVTAMCIYYARIGKDKDFIKEYVSKHYNIDFELENLRKNYTFNETCENTVPQAIFCFLISSSFEDCLRKSVSIGGDTDTLCAISCAIAEAYYKDIDKKLIDFVLNKLPEDKNGLSPRSLVQDFIEYKIYSQISTTEITKETIFIKIESRKKIEFIYSNRVSAIRDYILFELSDILSIKEKELFDKINNIDGLHLLINTLNERFHNICYEIVNNDEIIYQLYNINRCELKNIINSSYYTK